MRKATSVAILECILCGERFSQRDVKSLRYFPSTQVCYGCYCKGQLSSHVLWCFGKKSIQSPDGKVLEYGYDLEARACRLECPDRKLCGMFVHGDLGAAMRKHIKEAKDLVCPFRQTQSQIARVWMACATKGMLVGDVIKWVEREGGSARRVMKVLRSGNLLGIRWRVDEENGFLKLTYLGGGVKRESDERD